MFKFLTRHVQAIQKNLAQIESKIGAMRSADHSLAAVYMGNNRVLMRCVVAGRTIAYLLEADDRLLTPWFIVTGKYETPLTDYFVRALKHDSHCIDLGANFGYFSCLMASFCPNGKVIGVEADFEVFELARDNIFINGSRGVGEIIHAAASDSLEPVTLHRRHFRSGNTSIVKYGKDMFDYHGEPESDEFVVSGVTIDSLLERMDGRIDFIKIDIEGAEPLAIRGARETIDRNPQLQIIMEWSPGQISVAGFDLNAFVAELEALQLQCFDIYSTTPRKISYADLLAMDYSAGILLTRQSPL
jgi:FkbM family methyltransferase